MAKKLTKTEQRLDSIERALENHTWDLEGLQGYNKRREEEKEEAVKRSECRQWFVFYAVVFMVVGACIMKAVGCF